MTFQMIPEMPPPKWFRPECSQQDIQNFFRSRMSSGPQLLDDLSNPSKVCKTCKEEPCRCHNLGVDILTHCSFDPESFKIDTTTGSELDELCARFYGSKVSM